MALVEIEVAQGVQFDPGDRAKVRAILERYTSGSAVNGAGATRLGDTLDAGRAAGARVRREMEHNAAVAKARVDFWNKIDDEFHRCGQR